MTTNTNMSTDFKKEQNWSIVMGVLLIILGVVAIALPNVSTIVTETWIAFVLISAGTGKLIYAFQSRQQGGLIWKVLLSLLYIGVGIVLLVYPLSGTLTLTLLLGSFLLTEGVFELVLAFQLRSEQNWGWVLLNAIVTLLLGVMIWYQWPFDAPWLIGTLVGASIIFTGVSRVMMSLNPQSTTPQT
jgi:uncharacterized membrane protein HdeD (DUF308 family)